LGSGLFLCNNHWFHLNWVAITKTVDKSVAVPLTTIVYTLRYSNTSSYTAQNVFIADILPTWLTLVSASVGNTGTWFAIGDLAPGASGTIVVQAMINDGFVWSITNTASISTTTPGTVSSPSSVTTLVPPITVGGWAYTYVSYGWAPSSNTPSNPVVTAIEEEPNIIETPLYEAQVWNTTILTPYKKLPKKTTKSGVDILNAIVTAQKQVQIPTEAITEDLSF
jgi:uncharacterized repeat protein (TIGR01451 family)